MTFDNLSLLINQLNNFKNKPLPEAKRIFHGRGQCYLNLEWLTVDAYHPLLLITVYLTPNEAHLISVIEAIRHNLPLGFTHVLLQRRDLPSSPYEWLLGNPIPSGNVFAVRGKLKFILDFQQQNCGYFLDMEPGRRWLEQHTAGAKVLNLFSYTCALSVVAKAAGADGVVNVDLSRRSLTSGRENHRLNLQDTASITFLAVDILKSWGKLKKLGPYDIVIVDPPSFQKGSFVAATDYQKVVRRLPELLIDGGKVLACLNAPERTSEDLQRFFTAHAPTLKYIERLLPSHDFPDVNIEQQLKLLVYSAG